MDFNRNSSEDFRQQRKGFVANSLIAPIAFFLCVYCV